MSIIRENHQQNTKQGIDQHALIFGLIAVFLCGIGFSIVMPVIPFLVQPYVKSPGEQAVMVTLLTSVYAVCVFFAAPVLGALSDKYGRRPVLLLCLSGSALGYFVFGIGGSLGILFVGRIIEGITGGSIGTLFAYFADIIPSEERTKYFGWVSAVAGVGSITGPTLGGLLSKFGYSMPLYFGVIITLMNVIYGFLHMPESLHKEHRLQKIASERFNPFKQLAGLLSQKSLKWLMISAFLLWIPNGSLQAVFSQFTMDTFSWKPPMIGLVCSIMGFQDIVSQGFIMPKLLVRFSDRQIAMLGMSSEIIGYGFIAASAFFLYYPLFIVGMFIFGFGDSIFGPAFNGMLSKSAKAGEQGQLQGGSQSIQALARVIGPILGGQIYVGIDHGSPAVMGIILITVAIAVLFKGTRADVKILQTSKTLL